MKESLLYHCYSHASSEEELLVDQLLQCMNILSLRFVWASGLSFVFRSALVTPLSNASGRLKNVNIVADDDVGQ